MHLKISSAKWWPFCPPGDELIWQVWYDWSNAHDCCYLSREINIPPHQLWSYPIILITRLSHGWLMGNWGEGGIWAHVYDDIITWKHFLHCWLVCEEKPPFDSLQYSLMLVCEENHQWIPLSKLPVIWDAMTFMWHAYHDDVIKWKHVPRYWHLCGEFTGPRWIPHTKASDVELWCFLRSGPK